MVNFHSVPDSSKDKIDQAINNIVATSHDLKDDWEQMKTSYENYSTDRLDYVDIGIISTYIISIWKSKQHEYLSPIFFEIEKAILSDSDNVKNLMVVGILEGIQNKLSHEYESYYSYFDQWLLPQTKLEWYKLIDFWHNRDTN